MKPVIASTNGKRSAIISLDTAFPNRAFAIILEDSEQAKEVFLIPKS